MHPFSFVQHATHNPTQNPSEASEQPFHQTPDRLPWQTQNEAENDLWALRQTPPSSTQSTGELCQPQTEETDPRILAMERNEPKRRLIRDAKALCKIRKITQAQLAEEIGVPRRTAEEWLQFRRMPKAAGETLLRRWVKAHIDEMS